MKSGRVQTPARSVGGARFPVIAATMAPLPPRLLIATAGPAALRPES